MRRLPRRTATLSPLSNSRHGDCNFPRFPRLARRGDTVLVTPAYVIPLELKPGAKKGNQIDYEQA